MNDEKSDFIARVLQLKQDYLADSKFRKTLRDKPEETLRNLGFSIPHGYRVKLVEETPSEKFLVIPDPGGYAEVNEEALAGVSGGQSGGQSGAPSNCMQCYNGTHPYHGRAVYTVSSL